MHKYGQAIRHKDELPEETLRETLAHLSRRGGFVPEEFVFNKPIHSRDIWTGELFDGYGSAWLSNQKVAQS